VAATLCAGPLRQPPSPRHLGCFSEHSGLHTENRYAPASRRKHRREDVPIQVALRRAHLGYFRLQSAKWLWRPEERASLAVHEQRGLRDERPRFRDEDFADESRQRLTRYPADQEFRPSRRKQGVRGRSGDLI